MPNHVIFPKSFSRFLGQCGMTRSGLLRALMGIRRDLEAMAPVDRQPRVPNEPELFFYEFQLIDTQRVHTIRLLVDDVQAQGYLFVVSAEHDVGPTLP